ncbi:MAG: hypothetical protein V1676_05115 [Candidatus Diapherotrites archaeon]
MNLDSARLLLPAALIAVAIACAGAAYAEECAIVCSSDAACNDGNPDTWDLCFRTGTCESGCANLNCMPLCKTDADCDDKVAATKDVCAGARRCEAACFHLSGCGDGVCDESAEETRCTCPQDCGDCGETQAGVCGEKACVGKQCVSTIMLGCCGNGRCEAGEKYANCSADCMPANVEIAFVGEWQDYYARGDRMDIVVSVAADGTKAAGAKVTARGFFGELKLYNDGAHNDGTENDGRYGNSVALVDDAAAGEYDIEVSAEFAGATGKITKTAVVRAELGVALETDREKYSAGDIIKISGTVKKHGVGVETAVDLNLLARGGVVWQGTVRSDAGGNFGAEYHTTLLNPTGKWVASIWCRDGKNNVGAAEKEITVISPEATSQLEIRVLNGLAKAYERGDTVDLNVALESAEGSGISGAKATLLSPAGKSTEFKEAVRGIYSNRIILGWDFPVGKNSLEIRGVKSDRNTVYGGSFSFDIYVEPAALTIDVAEPAGRTFEAGEQINFRLMLSYPDGKPVTNAEVDANVNGTGVGMVSSERGVYAGSYVVRAEDVGLAEFGVAAEDAYGNSGTRSVQFEIAGVSAWHYLRSYIGHIIVALLVAAVATATVIYAKRRSAQIGTLKNRERQLLGELKGFQRQFFREATLDKANYDRLVGECETELDDVRKSLALIGAGNGKGTGKKSGTGNVQGSACDARGAQGGRWAAGKGGGEK